MPTEQSTPRRKRHFTRRFVVTVVVIVASVAWFGWRVHAYRSAIKKAEAMGWTVGYIEPDKAIRADWKNAFRKRTWIDGATHVVTPTSEQLQWHLEIVQRLNPLGLGIADAASVRDLSTIGSLTGLKALGLSGCTSLTNADGLKNLSALQSVYLGGWTGLKSVDALKNLSALQRVWLIGCTGLTNIDALGNVSALEMVDLSYCTGLTNVEALKSLSALQQVNLSGCTSLKNVDALKILPALEWVDLTGCTGLTRESLEALRAALPKATILEP